VTHVLVRKSDPAQEKQRSKNLQTFMDNCCSYNERKPEREKSRNNGKQA
jgi:hypothetical protein